MLLLVAVAAAHPGLLPHFHSADPVAVAVVGFWLVAGAAFVAGSWRAFATAKPG